MGAAKATLGFPSRTAAIVALRNDGVCIAEIARRIGIEPKTVTALEASAARASARNRHVRIPQIDRVPAAVWSLPSDALMELRPHAKRRNMTAYDLARDIVCRVIDDGLVDAVMDDAGEVT